MATHQEKEREAKPEGTMYTNCLLLGLNTAILGSPTSQRVGLFRHSNPRLGEQLLYFLLSSLRGPAQSSKDFDKVWPIFDSAQSREFRKIVQGIISELEQQGALPRSNSRVSSLATCCGPRLVVMDAFSLAFVEEVMEFVELNLLSGALVGPPGVNGLCTERKRLTIVVELIANPSIVFMDEPTSAFDARSAAIMMRTLRNIVNTGRTIVCTIHQPSINIFESFDEISFY